MKDGGREEGKGRRVSRGFACVNEEKENSNKRTPSSKPSRAIGVVRRGLDDCFLSYFHRHDTLVPSFDHLSEGEAREGGRERGAGEMKRKMDKDTRKGK